MKKRIPFIKALAMLLTLLLVVPPGVMAQSGGGDKPFSQEQLDQLVAPIALYPDSLLAQIFMASTYPLEVVQAARWVKANKTLKADALTAALEKENWDPSVKSLVNFPQVLDMMNEKLDWTQKMGDAFLAQQKDVMDTVQQLRAKAQAAGNLKTTEQQTVVVEKETQTIIIQSASPQVVYVPTYNPDGGLRRLGVSGVSALHLLSSRIRGRRGLVFLRRGCCRRGSLGLCVGKLQLERRGCQCKYQPEREHQ